MQDKIVQTFFDKKAAYSYDERNAKLKSINDNLYLLTRLVLAGLPDHATILCVGVGTGREIISLAGIYPNWRFVGVDPSESMLEVCQKNLEKEGVASRCRLIHGYLSDIVRNDGFDAVLCFLVAHFIQNAAARQDLYADMHHMLKNGGYLVNAEISGDVSSPEFNDIIEKWKAMHALAGTTDENLARMVQAMEENLAVLPAHKVDNLLRQAGFPLPVIFFQSLLIQAWYAQKTVLP